MARTSTLEPEGLVERTTASSPRASRTRRSASRELRAVKRLTFMTPPSVGSQGRLAEGLAAANESEREGSCCCSDDRADADGMGLGNLAVREHLQARCGPLQKACHRRANQVGHQQAGRMTEVFLALGRLGGAAAQGVGHARV